MADVWQEVEDLRVENRQLRDEVEVQRQQLNDCVGLVLDNKRLMDAMRDLLDYCDPAIQPKPVQNARALLIEVTHEKDVRRATLASAAAFNDRGEGGGE